MLHVVVLPLRCAKLAQRYRAIWRPDGSPLLVYGRRQQQALAARLGPKVAVELGMVYGAPSVATAVAGLLAQGVTNLVVLPLFPHYCSVTTAAAWDALAMALRCHRNLPQVHFVRDYAAHPLFIQALQQQISHTFATKGKPDMLLFSYHGIPQRYVQQGDAYPQRCQVTTQAVANGLALTKQQYLLSYQSRFGYSSWLKPYTDRVLQLLAQQGVRHLQIIAPSFASDCLETLEELAEQGRAIFFKAGGQRFHYIPALNNTSSHIELLQAIVTSSLAR